MVLLLAWQLSPYYNPVQLRLLQLAVISGYITFYTTTKTTT